MADYFSAAHDDTGDNLVADSGVHTGPHVFTWLLPEHHECEHKAGETVAVKTGGKQRAFCQLCNLLVDPIQVTKAATSAAASRKRSPAAGARS